MYNLFWVWLDNFLRACTARRASTLYREDRMSVGSKLKNFFSGGGDDEEEYPPEPEEREDDTRGFLTDSVDSVNTQHMS